MMGRQIPESSVDVVILELNGDVAEQAARELSADAEGGTRVIASVGSVESAGDVAAAFDTATAGFGAPQILVNNADWDAVADRRGRE
jgi:NAD(P)-dependent dehydrogenase (short-subunit alcohol dehydrogenase family)